MSRRPRTDSPNTWFHVMNRGIARRTLFERREDMNFFLNGLAEAREREELEVHAYCLMATHYHLLARSPIGELARGMQRVQTEYSRWFNRSRKRDGPLVRGRYFAKEVNSRFYRRTLVRYIDWNPVRARLVASADVYPYGSAQSYSKTTGTDLPWLERAWVESEVCSVLDLREYDATRYSGVFPLLPRKFAGVVDARWRSRMREDPLDDLIQASPAAVVSWMRKKAKLADGTPPGLPVLAFADLERAVRTHAKRDLTPWRVGPHQGWLIVCAGLARELCGLTLDEIGRRLTLSRSQASRLCRQHRNLVLENQNYADRSASVAARALETWTRGSG